MGRYRWLKWLFVVTLSGWMMSSQVMELDVVLGGRLLGVFSEERVAGAVRSGASVEANVITFLWRIAMQHGCAILAMMVVAYVLHAILSGTEVWTLLSRIFRKHAWMRGIAVAGVTSFLLVPALYYGQDFSTAVGLMAQPVI
jgi:hypothetical protein